MRNVMPPTVTTVTRKIACTEWPNDAVDSPWGRASILVGHSTIG